jgi:hypothetical protein
MYLLCCLVVDVHEEEIFPNITTEIVAQTAHFSSELVISFSMQQVEENSS